MKKLLFFMLIPIISIAQDKGTSQIIIKNSLSAADNYKLIATTLLDAGYSIDKKDNEFLTIKTQPKIVNKISSYFLNIRAKDNEIQINGMAKAGFTLSIAGVTDTDEYVPIQNKGAKGSWLRNAFAEMQKFAELFNSPISYN